MATVPAVIVSAPAPPVTESTPIVKKTIVAGVVGVVVVVVSVVVVLESEDPQAANDRAIKDTPPARAAFAFFFSQTAANFSIM